MTGGEWLVFLILVVMILCQVEELEDAYRERTKAMLRIAGVTQLEAPSRLWSWVKERMNK